MIDGPAPLLADRVAVITGGGAGIGAASGLLFAQHGARWVIVDIDGTLADESVAAIRAAGGTADAIVADVRDSDRVLEVRD